MTAPFAHTLGAITPEYAEAAANVVLAEARAMCCDADPSLNHIARAEHSRVMAIAERLADAVRGMG